MYFPFWKYLNQPLGDSAYPPILNPLKYWQRYKIWRLNSCFNSNFLEQCWDISYQDFITFYHALCDRNSLEEDPVWLLERCWRLEKRTRYSFHPENKPSEAEP